MTCEEVVDTDLKINYNVQQLLETLVILIAGEDALPQLYDIALPSNGS